jgi:hypothetical protein
MVAVASCFAQILSLIDRAGFARAVRQNQAERAAKGFGCWDHFVAMLFCQMGSAHSLREICGGLATALGKLVHLGVRRTPTRSTLPMPMPIDRGKCTRRSSIRCSPSGRRWQT